MTDNYWNSPILVENPQTGGMQAVRTVRQAKAFLDGLGTLDHGSRYHHAEEVCQAAIAGSTSECEARQAFISAAVEAHLHLR
jgi:hypothetical protein